MNGRASPYTRNVKNDVASAIISAGLLGQFGGDLLKENSGLHTTPKKKIVLPELQKKTKPQDETVSTPTHYGELGKKKRPLGVSESEIIPNNFSNNTSNNNENIHDSEIRPDDLRSSHSPLHSPLSPLSSSTLHENSATPTFAPESQTTNPTSNNINPSPNINASNNNFTPSPNPPTPAPPNTKMHFPFGPNTPNTNNNKNNKKNKSKQADENVEIPPTKIPERYHVADQSPIRPHALEEGETLAYSTQQGWQKKWFPSDRPQGRREVLQLMRTFEMMLEELSAPSQPGATPSAPPLSEIEKEQNIYDTILHEIIRQVTVECADRGVLLEKVSRRYRRLFSRVPLILSEMQQEIDGLVDANKSLRLLLERLMETKSDVESQAKDTRDRILQVEEINVTHKAEIEQNIATIQQLKKERDEAVEEEKRQRERHYYQERLNSELLSKDEYNKATIRSLGKQLEDAINSLHDMEAKYLSVKSQQSEAKQINTLQRGEVLHLNEDMGTMSILGEQKVQLKEREEREGGEEDEREDVEEGQEQPRASTADTSKGRKKLQSTISKAATFDSTNKKKVKEKETDGPQRLKTAKKKDINLQKPTSPNLKLRTSSHSPGD